MKKKVEIPRTNIVSARSRAYLALQHLFSAVNIAVSIPSADVPRPLSVEVGAIFCSVAFLDSLINEFWADTMDDHFPDGVGTPALDPLSRILKAGDLSRLNVFEKYQVTLTAMDRPAFEKGKNPYQSAQFAVRVRNALIHYEPKWVVDGEWHQLDKSLKSTTGMTAPAPGFPYWCYSLDYVCWSIRAIGEFADQFCASMGDLLYCQEKRDAIAKEMSRLPK